MKNVILFFVLIFMVACSSDSVKENLNKAGDVTGQTVGEFASGVSSGVAKAFEIDPELDVALSNKGLSIGKVSVTSDTLGTDNVLITYMIFDTTFKENIVVKVFDKNNKEIGRCAKKVSGRVDQAHYVEFVFDKYTNIDNDSKIVIGN